MPSAVFVFLKCSMPEQAFRQLIDQLSAFFTYVWILVEKPYTHQISASLFPRQDTNNSKNSNSFVARIKRVDPNIKYYSLKLNLVEVIELYQKEDVDCRRFVDCYTTKYTTANLMETVRMIKNKFEKRRAIVSIGNVMTDTNPSGVNVIVFDLDETLIDENYKPLINNVPKFLNTVSTLFHYVVLWSHGTAAHVKKALSKIKCSSMFNVVVCREDAEHNRNKGLGYILRTLNNKFGVTRIKTAVLVDDLRDNFIDDYDYFLHVPSNFSEVPKFYNSAFDVLQQFMYENKNVGQVLSMNNLSRFRGN